MSFGAHHFPAHIDGFVRDATHRFSRDADQFHFFFQVVCSCGESFFKVRKSQHQSLYAECMACGQVISVYDLAKYPAATKPSEAEEFNWVSLPNGATHGSVFVMYEYGELDDDQEFDRNDITWCQAWLEDADRSLTLVLNDETA